MDRSIGKTQLSRSILDMKFMKRTKEKVEQQTFQSQGEEYFENELTTKMKKDTGMYTIEQSYIYCERLIDGRLSFQGMNPEIEKIMELENNMKQSKDEKPQEIEISNEQMAKRWRQSQVETMKKRFQTKRHRNSNFKHIKFDDDCQIKKLKFAKPSD